LGHFEEYLSFLLGSSSSSPVFAFLGVLAEFFADDMTQSALCAWNNIPEAKRLQHGTVQKGGFFVAPQLGTAFFSQRDVCLATVSDVAVQANEVCCAAKFAALQTRLSFKDVVGCSSPA
jgi:hypothetical protein